jgi:hypothetical protein
MNNKDITAIRQEIIDNFSSLDPEEQQIFKNGIDTDYGKFIQRILPDQIIGDMIQLLDEQEEDQTESALGTL